MPRESKAARAARCRAIAQALYTAYPDARCALEFATPFELLVATVLAAQCTDVKVNEVTAELFRDAGTPEALAAMPVEALQARIRPTGFFRNKAKALKGLSRRILDEHNGRVPRDIDALLALPGVARKTANVVREAAWGVPGIICDTHMIRLSGRMRLSRHPDPVKLERDLQVLVPRADWGRFSHAMVFHGRRCCAARKPACDACPVARLCPSAFAFPAFKAKAATKGRKKGKPKGR